MKYIIGTGWYDTPGSEEFYRQYWLPNTLKYSNPEKIFILNSSAPKIEKTSEKEEWSNLTINPGHSHKEGRLGGWTLGFIHGAMYAYSCGCDYIYKEQDCLAFGDWINKTYQLASKYSAISGELPNHPNVNLTQELCLTYIKYEFIIQFLSEWFALEHQKASGWPEGTYVRIKNKHPELFGNFDFGFGGNRPFKTEETFYIQKPRWFPDKKSPIGAGGFGIPDEEIQQLKKARLI